MGVFFDGTGNSRKDSATYSNVAKLYEAYKILNDEPSYRGKKTTTAKLYITGVGTATMNHSGHGLHYQGRYMEEKDASSTKHYGGYKNEGAAELAAGGGGAKRIYDAIDKVCKELDAHPYSRNDNTKYMYRIIDVFGFSRGAAEARDFVNTFYREATMGANKKYQDVRFNFIGIFDTVGSFGAAGNAIDMKPKREYANNASESDGFLLQDDHEDDPEYESYNFHLRQQSASKIVHLTAADEVRHNFPLTNIQGSGGIELQALGVHSDIGGGYEPLCHERLCIGGEFNEAKKQELLSMGWKHHRKVPLSLSMSGMVVPTVQQLRADNNYFYFDRTVDNKLSDITLHLMYRFAKQTDVPFEDIESKHPIDSRLMAYDAYAMQNPHTITRYAEAKKIRWYHAHQSATQPLKYVPYILREPDGFAEEQVDSNVVNLVNNIPKRAIYNNHSYKAIVPREA